MCERWVYEPVELSVSELLLSIMEHLPDQSGIQLADLADAGQFHRFCHGLPFRFDARLHGWRPRGILRGEVGNNGHTYSSDIASGNINTMLWGCVGFHYSGDWYDGNSSGGAIWYINQAKAALSQKSWKTRWPTVNWPG